MKRTLKITKEGKMTGLKVVLITLAILLAIPYIVFLYMGTRMEKEMNEIFEKEWKNDNDS